MGAPKDVLVIKWERSCPLHRRISMVFRFGAWCVPHASRCQGWISEQWISPQMLMAERSRVSFAMRQRTQETATKLSMGRCVMGRICSENMEKREPHVGWLGAKIVDV